MSEASVRKYVLEGRVGAPPPSLERFRQELNEAQFAAATAPDGSTLIIAGAGSGKTRTLIYRVAYLIERGVPPSEILLLTFTRKSSEQLLQRAAALLDDRCRQIQGGTFHSFAHQMLRRYASLVHFPNNFLVIDRSDAEDIVNLVRTERGLSEKEKRFPKKGTLLDIFSKSINRAKPIASILKAEYPQFVSEQGEIAALCDAFQLFKSKQALMDYDDLLVLFANLLEQNPETARSISSRLRHVLIDEYQDTNLLQAKIARALAQVHGNITVVGDDAQSIYSFRGATVRNILDFPEQFPGTRLILLEENYRSTQPILAFANAILAQAKEGFSKQLHSEIESEQRPVRIKAMSIHEQADFVAQRVLELREEGVPLSEVAVLFRSGWHSNELEVELAARGIPFVKYGGLKFVEAAHVKDMIAFVRVGENPLDSLSWFRLLLLLEGVGPKTARDVVNTIMSSGGKLSALVDVAHKKKGELQSLYNALEKMHNESDPASKVRSLLKFYEPLLKRTYDDYRKRQDDLDSLVQIAERYTSVEHFLSDISLDPPSGSQTDVAGEGLDDEKLVLSTVHSAKGLEWHSVFVISLIDGYIPSSQAISSSDDIEEERRLFYVACTRAKRNLYLITPEFAQGRGTAVMYGGMGFSNPSRFLSEIRDLQSLSEEWELSGQFY